MSAENVNKSDKDKPVIAVAPLLPCQFCKKSRPRINKMHIFSVWDAAKMICLNRIHRIPIVHFDEFVNGVDYRKQQGNLLYVLSLKTVFTETIVKLVRIFLYGHESASPLGCCCPLNLFTSLHCL